ncbi:MAG: hypothetical protein FJX54_04225 [Alphaproteobacteria bacterium]|nr:hypothetical protein [Alphaproteobacteria bacterium]
MSAPEPMNRAEVETCLKRAGLTLSTEQIDDIHRVSGYVREYLAQLGNDRPVSVEPALTFKVTP